MVLPRTTRLSPASTSATQVIQASTTYAYQRGAAVARGVNLNAPIDGARPDPVFGNIIEVSPTPARASTSCRSNLTMNPGALLPQSTTAPRVSVKRVTLFVNHTLARTRNNTDGAFSVPPTGISTWSGARRTTTCVTGSTRRSTIRSSRTSGSASAFNLSSGSPYTIRTGLDDNGDFIFNDRPAGIARNTERASGTCSMNMNINYNWRSARRRAGRPASACSSAAPAPRRVRTVDAPSRYRLSVFLFAQNLTNHANYPGYSGVMTSPFFRQATAVAGTRRVEAGLNFGF